MWVRERGFKFYIDVGVGGCVRGGEEEESRLRLEMDEWVKVGEW